jgi:hypothetical protein
MIEIEIYALDTHPPAPHRLRWTKIRAAIQTDQDDPYRSAEIEGTQNTVSSATQID